jgi:hypothetical protein
MCATIASGFDPVAQPPIAATDTINPAKTIFLAKHFI